MKNIYQDYNNNELLNLYFTLIKRDGFDFNISNKILNNIDEKQRKVFFKFLEKHYKESLELNNMFHNIKDIFEIKENYINFDSILKKLYITNIKIFDNEKIKLLKINNNKNSIFTEDFLKFIKDNINNDSRYLYYLSNTEKYIKKTFISEKKEVFIQPEIYRKKNIKNYLLNSLKILYKEDNEISNLLNENIFNELFFKNFEEQKSLQNLNFYNDKFINIFIEKNGNVIYNDFYKKSELFFNIINKDEINNTKTIIEDMIINNILNLKKDDINLLLQINKIKLDYFNKQKEITLSFIKDVIENFIENKTSNLKQTKEYIKICLKTFENSNNDINNIYFSDKDKENFINDNNNKLNSLSFLSLFYNNVKEKELELKQKEKRNDNLIIIDFS